MKTFSALCSLLFLTYQAVADVQVCGTNLNTPTTIGLRPGIQNALSQYEIGLRHLPPPAGQSLASQVTTWYKSRLFRRGANSLLKVFVPIHDRAEVCEQFVKLTSDYQAINNQPGTILRLIDSLCSQTQHDVVMRLTAQSLETQQGSRWIRALIQNSVLSMSDWRELLSANCQNRLSSLVAVIGANWSSLGFYPDDLEQLARIALKQQVSVYHLTRLFKLTDEQLANLAPAMDPLQWLELMERTGYPVLNLAQELKARVTNFKKPDNITDKQGLNAV